jgi:hypothetical protein
VVFSCHSWNFFIISFSVSLARMTSSGALLCKWVVNKEVRAWISLFLYLPSQINSDVCVLALKLISRHKGGRVNGVPAA